MGMKRNPAVMAGLLGLASVSVPDAAYALTVREVFDVVLDRPEFAFAAGALVGVLATGAVARAAAAVSRRRRRRREEAARVAAEEEERSLYQPRHMRVEAEEEPSEELGAVPSHGPSHAASNYEQIAENYVKRASFRSRMARRAEGVAATLRERMGASMMEGVPVIARADGTVADVGTSWWQTAVGEDAIKNSRIVEDTSEALAIPSDFSVTDVERLASAAKRAEGISRRVAQVDEGAYPELRTGEDLDRSDAWACALKSMDEKIAAAGPVPEPIGFIDTVGGADTLDEPDNLELDTAFIPFRTPAGHPEVVDTDSYVDYLIEDEFSKNACPVVRRHSRHFLRVLEGGTHSSRRITDTDALEGYAPKHFAVQEAIEA